MQPKERRQSMRVHRRFAGVVEAFSKDRAVDVGGGKGFGSGALRVNGKVFAMISSQDQFVVKVSKSRVDELAASGIGVRFEPRPGKPMKEWLVVESENQGWVDLAKEAFEFVRSGKP